VYNNIKKIHLIGIGGIGVSGIAELLHQHGYLVTGSDVRRSETVKHLESVGINVALGHSASNIQGADLAVYSSAISEENPEMVAAAELGIPVIPRAEMLAELMRLNYGIAVAGAHGKTSTTSMIAHILVEAKMDPTIVVGGRMDNFGGTNARLGSGEFIVAEADESDGSFNKLSPSIAVVTNIDREHMEYYKTMRRLKSSFLSFLNKVPFYGLAVINADDPYLQILSKRITRRVVTFGWKPTSHYRILSYEVTNEGSQTRIKTRASEADLRLKVPGKHNLLNALAAFAVADELSIPMETTLEALYSYQGVQRRFQYMGEIDGVHFIDDYAHHPTEIRVTLEAARERFPEAKLRAVFQPHRFSRVEDLFQEFTDCFNNSDGVYITNIYSAGEKNDGHIHGELLVENMQRSGNRSALFVDSAKEGLLQARSKSKPGDVILTLGAGDIPNVYRDLF